MHYTFAICSDEALLRQSLVMSLGHEAQARCIAEFSCTEDLRRAAISGDLLLLDVDGPEDFSDRGQQRALNARRFRHVMLLTNARGGFAAHLVWACNWQGLVLKTDTVASMRAAIDQVIKGGVAMSSHASLAERVHFSRVLSERESELLREMVLQEDHESVARCFGLTPATVRTHRRNIFRKLDLRSQAGLVRFALRTGLVSTQAFIGKR